VIFGYFIMKKILDSAVLLSKEIYTTNGHLRHFSFSFMFEINSLRLKVLKTVRQCGYKLERKTFM
jgi:hypothetical protein